MHAAYHAACRAIQRRSWTDLAPHDLAGSPWSPDCHRACSSGSFSPITAVQRSCKQPITVFLSFRTPWPYPRQPATYEGACDNVPGDETNKLHVGLYRDFERRGLKPGVGGSLS